MGNKNLRRLSLVVTAQTAWHLEQLARVCGYREIGHVVDKLVREKTLSIRIPALAPAGTKSPPRDGAGERNAY